MVIYVKSLDKNPGYSVSAVHYLAQGSATRTAEQRISALTKSLRDVLCAGSRPCALQAARLFNSVTSNRIVFVVCVVLVFVLYGMLNEVCEPLLRYQFLRHLKLRAFTLNELAGLPDTGLQCFAAVPRRSRTRRLGALRPRG